MSEQETTQSSRREFRRAADVQIPMLSEKVGHLEATVESQGRWLRDVDNKVDDTRKELGAKLDGIAHSLDQRTRFPMLQFVALLFTGGAVLITLGVQALKGQNEVSEARFARLLSQQITHEEHGVRHKEDFRKHIRDGHSASVRNLLDRIEKEVHGKIDAVDKQHADENVEQEDDIEALRRRDSAFEIRNDQQDSRLTKLETEREQLVKRFESVLRYRDRITSLRSDDRWTGTQENIYQEGHKRLHDDLARQVESIIRNLSEPKNQ